MLLTISTTHQPATDLGYLLHKHPDRVQTFNLAFGKAHVFYPEVSDERCTAALLLDIDPIGLVRGDRGGFELAQYVNDRPYVASSFLSVAIVQVYGSALAGRCKDRPDLVTTPIPLQATLSVLPCRGGDALLRRLFEPLGYTVTAQRHPLDETFPAWGESAYYTVTLDAITRLSDLLAHLYVFIPVLDDEKHYYVGDEEIQKLLKRGEGWLAAHPERELIANRYLKHKHHLMREALARLTEGEQADETEAVYDKEERAVEEKISLNKQRIGAVMATLKASGARRVLDLGCGEGQLIRQLIEDRTFETILGMDVSYRALEIANDRLRLERLPEVQRERVTLVQGSLIYRDPRLSGYDAAAVVEVIEHLDPPRLAAFERVLFEFARPGTVVVTTPNAEYNIMWEMLPAGKFRHKDHRFEWTRAEFQAWASAVAARFGYSVRFLPVGPEDEAVGSPTQMGVFTVLQIRKEIEHA
jgi:3' terminal RNA ribose 2'-O-methyltransferase Hen1